MNLINMETLVLQKLIVEYTYPSSTLLSFYFFYKKNRNSSDINNLIGLEIKKKNL